MLLIIVANVILPIMAVQSMPAFIKNAFANNQNSKELSEPFKREMDRELENTFSKLSYEMILNWSNTTEDLINHDNFVYTDSYQVLCNPKLDATEPFFERIDRYLTQRRCGRQHCEQFRHELDKRNLCKDLYVPKIKPTTTVGKAFVGVDEENVRCLAVESNRTAYLNVFKKSPKVCLCTYVVSLHSSLVAYLVYESVNNRGVYHYTRLQEYPYNIIPDERARHFKDNKLKVSWRNLFQFDGNLLKKYRELFLMEHTTSSTCHTGAFKVVRKEKYNGPPDSTSTDGTDASSSSSYSVPSSPIRPPPSPLSFIPSSSSST
ncbi:hypothetical protein WDU94_010845 [Cyamophila willieti]